ncbi:MAG TPA: alpha/beta fold hydrolase, partial [Egibacteraceae bacterium]|nr:alpha/beta fold hydrolase [Egibacteraceae bacterium]
MTEPGASSSERGAVLVLHGFTARPRTVEPLGAHLAAAGFTYAIPPLRGHGTHYRDLAAVNWQDWVEDGRNTFESLARHHSRVSIVGHSVGALVAAALAAGDPRVASLVLVAPAILYANPAVTLLPLLRRFVTEWPSGPDSINDPALRTAYAGTNY